MVRIVFHIESKQIIQMIENPGEAQTLCPNGVAYVDCHYSELTEVIANNGLIEPVNEFEQ